MDDATWEHLRNWLRRVWCGDTDDIQELADEVFDYLNSMPKEDAEYLLDRGWLAVMEQGQKEGRFV